MFQNDPMLWSYAGKDREQALLQEAEEYRRAKQVGQRQPVLTQQKLVIALAVAALVILGVAWMVVAG